MTYLESAEFHALVANLVAAARHPFDPETALTEILSAHIAPESCREEIEQMDREEIERMNREALDRYVAQETRLPEGRLDLDALIAADDADEAKRQAA